MGATNRTRNVGRVQDISCEAFPLTEVGNAERFVAYKRDSIRYCAQHGTWFVWNGQIWEEWETSQIRRLAIDTLRAARDTVWESSDPQKTRTISYLEKSETLRAIRAMVELAQGLPGVAVKPDEFNRDNWLLTVRNGTLNLKTGDLLEHNPGHLITRRLRVDYDPNAACPNWERFIDRVTGGNEALAQYLQRVAGYCLTGDTSEQCFFLLYGPGANGKSTFTHIMECLLGDFARQADFGTFLESPYDRIRNDIARLQHARLVLAAETNGLRALDEVVVKQITGEDTITARFLRKEYFEFTVKFKLILVANLKPVIRGTDYGIWRRTRPIEFSVTIPEAERDPYLKAKLRAELPGILAWAVRGCRDWQQNGLREPQELRQAAMEYEVEMDPIKQFIRDQCTIVPHARTAVCDLFRAYLRWAEEGEVRPMNDAQFGKRLTELGYASERSGSTRYRVGIALLPGQSMAA